MKKITAILTAASITAAMAMPVSAAEEVYRVNCSSFGTDGSDVWASLDTDGVLTISGTGGMDSFGFGSDDIPDYPWENSEDANLIKKIVVEEGVTHFDMVWQTPEAKSVYLPNSLETIDLFEFIYLLDTDTKIFFSPQSFKNNPYTNDQTSNAELIEKIEEKASDCLCTFYIYKDTLQDFFESYYGVKSKYMGDVNSDGNIDLNDASGMLDFYAKSSAGIDISEDSIDTDTADLDKDGTIGLNDASAALKYYAGNSAGLETDWTEILRN